MLRDADRDGFVLEGSGTALVTTPPQHAPGSTVLATITDAAGTAERQLVADDEGRITVPVDLGPGNTEQQLSPTGNLVAAANGNQWPAVTATINLRELTSPAAPAAAAESQGQEIPATGHSVPTTLAFALLALALAARAIAGARATP